MKSGLSALLEDYIYIYIYIYKYIWENMLPEYEKEPKQDNGISQIQGKEIYCRIRKDNFSKILTGSVTRGK